MALRVWAPLVVVVLCVECGRVFTCVQRHTCWVENQRTTLGVSPQGSFCLRWSHSLAWNFAKSARLAGQ